MIVRIVKIMSEATQYTRKQTDWQTGGRIRCVRRRLKIKFIMAFTWAITNGSMQRVKYKFFRYLRRNWMQFFYELSEGSSNCSADLPNGHLGIVCLIIWKLSFSHIWIFPFFIELLFLPHFSYYSFVLCC